MNEASSDRLKILVVDDDELVRESLCSVLEGDGHTVVQAASSEQAIERIRAQVFELVFLDLRLGGESGLDLISRLHGEAPWVKIIMVTGHASVESAVEAMRKGAAEYLTKPVRSQQVRALAERLAAVRRLERRVQSLEEDAKAARPRSVLESRSPAMKRVFELAEQVAPSEAGILITGESGTGKGVLARAIHEWSPRSERAFGVVSCPSLSSELLQSELFGHVKGAFTGAVKTQAGKIDLAEGGTLFLDEIGDLPLNIQPKLLRFIQDREYERVGDPQPRSADVRIVSATNKELDQAVEDGEFREDLLYRLKVIELEVPPLRDRREDVEDYSQLFLRFFARRYNRKISGFSEAARDFLLDYSWPGNVRELQNAIERAVILCQVDEVPVELFPQAGTRTPRAQAPEKGEPLTLEELERRHIVEVLERTETIEDAAETLGIATSTLWRRRRKYGL